MPSNTFINNFLECEQVFFQKHALDEKLADTKKVVFLAERIITLNNIVRLDFFYIYPCFLWQCLLYFGNYLWFFCKLGLIRSCFQNRVS